MLEKRRCLPSSTKLRVVAIAKDPRVGTGKKPKGSGPRLYTAETPKDTVASPTQVADPELDVASDG